MARGRLRRLTTVVGHSYIDSQCHVMAGPRALQRLGEDYVGLSWLGSTNAHGLPRNAIVLMGVIALLFLWTSTFEQILLFAGLVMATNTLFTVMAVFVSRARRKREAQQSVFTIPFTPCRHYFWLSRAGPCHGSSVPFAAWHNTWFDRCWIPTVSTA